MTDPQGQGQQETTPNLGQDTGDATGANGGHDEVGDGLSHEQIMARIDAGDFDTRALAKAMIPKGEVNNVVSERLKRQDQKRLERLGVSDWEEAEAKLAAIREAEEEERSASERLETAQQERDRLKAEHDALTAVVEAQANSMLEGVPEHLKPLIEKMPVADRLSYLTENRERLIPRRAAGPGQLGPEEIAEHTGPIYTPNYNIPPASKG
jgi:hypothetical protein